MGESKLPLFAYVDETGNTGHNLFDEAQPDFLTAALFTVGDFDLRFGRDVGAISSSIGVTALHGRELGIAKLEGIAGDLEAILRRASARFFISRVEKRYLVATKIFDTFFDPGENAAVAWHHYNLRPSRLMLTFKLASTVDDFTARHFWNCLLARPEARAQGMIPSVCADLMRNLKYLKDLRAKQIFTEALDWAMKHPESIQMSNDRKIARQGHFPNFVAFVNLLDGLDVRSRDLRRPLSRIMHDQQSEFGKTLQAAHSMFSNAAAEEIVWAGEKLSLQKLPESKFILSDDGSSAGIQTTDVVLWLYAQFKKGRALPQRCRSLLRAVFANGWENDFSFKGVERQLLAEYGDVMFGPMSDEMMQRGKDMAAKLERDRVLAIERYEREAQPPFTYRRDIHTLTSEALWRPKR